MVVIIITITVINFVVKIFNHCFLPKQAILQLERWSEWLIIFVEWLALKFETLYRSLTDRSLRLPLIIFHAKFLFQNRLFLRKSWNRYFLSDKPCTVPLTIKNHSKKKPLDEKYQQYLFLQITTKLLKITSAFLTKNCDRLLLQITTKFWQIAIGITKSHPIRTHGNIYKGIVYFSPGPNLFWWKNVENKLTIIW